MPQHSTDTAALGRLGLFLGLPLMATLSLYGMAFYNAHLNTVDRRTSEITQEWLLAAEGFQIELIRAESSQRAYAIGGGVMFLEQWRSNIEGLRVKLAELQRLTLRLPHQSDSVASLERDVHARIELMQELVRKRTEEGFEAARAEVDSLRGKNLMDKIHGVAAGAADFERQRLKEQLIRRDSRSARLMRLLAGGAAFNILMVLAAYSLIRRELQAHSELALALEVSTRQMTLLHQFGIALQSSQALDDTGPVIRHYLSRMFPDTGGTLYLMRASRNALELVMQWGEQQAAPRAPIATEDCWALRQGKPYEVVDPAVDLKCAHLDDAQVRSLCVPLVARGDTLGVLTLLRGATPASAEQAPQRDWRQLLEAVAVEVGSAISNIMLREALRSQSIRDPLTGLYNRRYVEETVERERLRAIREHKPFSVIMIDLDHFKRLNDTYGHAAGDAVLQAFAGLLKANIRGEDIPCRYGGEEFLVILPGASPAIAQERAERLRVSFAGLTVPFRDQMLPGSSASFGVASFPDHGDAWQEVLDAADAALYAAKRAGRNCTVLADAIGQHEAEPEQALRSLPSA
jgi:diguanylate cyclase (GGDEF)-like protein